MKNIWKTYASNIWKTSEQLTLNSMNFCSEFSKAHKFFHVSIVKKLLKYIQFAKYLFVSYVYGITASFSYLVTPSFRSINSLLFEIREATKLSKSKKKISLDRIKFYWQTSVNFVGKNLPEKRFPHKVFLFFFKRINIESFRGEMPSTEKMELFWKKFSSSIIACAILRRKSLLLFYSFHRVPKHYWKTKMLERIHQRYDDIKFFIKISSKLR